MNEVFLMGRLTADPELRYTTGTNPTAIATYSLAVDRGYRKDDEKETDFLPIKAFGKAAEFAGKYLKKGMKIVVIGALRANRYTTQEGQSRTYSEVVATGQVFCESKGSNAQVGAPEDGFMNIPERLCHE